jgi:uroporphyrinogen decarboxylase
MLMAQDPDLTKSLFEKAADFSKRVVKNLLEFDIDIIHITGDVGSNRSMLFSPDMCRSLIMPFDREILRPAIDRKIPLSLHSCGYCMPVIQDWIDMGIRILHPIQESAGMDLYEVKDLYGEQITINGGLDIRELSTMKLSEVDDYVKTRVEYLKKGGGFIFNTSHTVQTDTSLEVLERAYDAAMEYGKYER